MDCWLFNLLVFFCNEVSPFIPCAIDGYKRPILFFKKDGTFINEGIEFSNLTYGDPYAIGKGTYEIINYSLLMHTESGKLLQVHSHLSLMEEQK